MSQRVSLTIEELAWLQVALANDLMAADDLVARIVDEGRRGIDLNTAKEQRDYIDRLYLKIVRAYSRSKQ